MRPSGLTLFCKFNHHFVEKMWYISLNKILHNRQKVADKISDEIIGLVSEKKCERKACKPARQTCTAMSWATLVVKVTLNKLFDVCSYVGIFYFPYII